MMDKPTCIQYTNHDYNYWFLKSGFCSTPRSALETILHSLWKHPHCLLPWPQMKSCSNSLLLGWRGPRPFFTILVSLREIQNGSFPYSTLPDVISNVSMISPLMRRSSYVVSWRILSFSLYGSKAMRSVSRVKERCISSSFSIYAFRFVGCFWVPYLNSLFNMGS